MGTKIISQSIQVSRGADRLGNIFYGSPVFAKEIFLSGSEEIIDAMSPVIITNKFKNINEDKVLEKPYVPIIMFDVESNELKTVDYYSLGEATCIQYSDAECYTVLDYIKNAVFVGDVVKLTFKNGIAIGDICISPTATMFSGILISSLPIEGLENSLSIRNFCIYMESIFDLCERKDSPTHLGNIIKVEKVSDVLTKGSFRFIFDIGLNKEIESLSIRVLSEEIHITHFGLSIKELEAIIYGSKNIEDISQTLIDLYLTQ